MVHAMMGWCEDLLEGFSWLLVVVVASSVNVGRFLFFVGGVG